MGYTTAEKIVLSHAEVDDVSPGDVVMLRCDVVLTNDISGPMAIQTLKQMGVDRVFDPTKVVVVPDHFVPAKDVRSAALQKRLKEWCDAQGVTLYDQGRGGIEHAVLVEEGWVLPGTVIAGGDSHTCTHGALGAFGTGLGSTDIASCLAYGRFWQAVPGTIQIELVGRLGPFVSGKDVILAVLDELGVAGGNEHVLEFVGDGAAALTIDERLGVANMAVEAGSENGLFPADETTTVYLEGRARAGWTAVASDGDATVARRFAVDLDHLPPLLAKPWSPGNIAPVADLLGTPVDQVYIGNCSNGTITDLRQAASMLAGNTVHPRTRAIIVPASQRIYAQALAEGLLEIFVAAGAMVSTPTCGACFGGSNGILAEGEVAVANTNRNFRGRMGARTSEIYLANSYVAAAAAVAGEIVDPATVNPPVPV
jgi:3-isopropylmalate/(R)-2-methylmalate dehydratase large subunit